MTIVATILFLYALGRSTARADDSELDAMKQTLPAYSIALNLQLLDSTSACSKDLADFRDAVDQRRLWSLRMLDASGEAKSGFIYGNNYWLGSRTQCQDVSNRSPFLLNRQVVLNNSRYRDPAHEHAPYDLNYFVAHFRHNSTLQYHIRLPNEDLVTLGLCLPASCTANELGEILKRIFRERTLLVGELYSADFRLIEVRDLRNDHKWLMNGNIIAIGVVLVLTCSAILMATVYDVLVHQKYLKAKNKFLCYENNNGRELDGVKCTSDASPISITQPPNRFWNIMLTFSAYTNTKILFNTRLSSDSVPDIHGLKFISMLWIIMVHTIYYMSDYADNKAWSWRISDGFAVQVISNSTLSVDTFFFLSGFLVAYMYLQRNGGKEKRKKVNYAVKLNEFLVTVIRRYIRLTPAYAMTIGITELNFGWYGKTSVFYMGERPQDTCPRYWWRNLLYINNLFSRDTMCMSWSWYLSNDMQFFIIATFVLILSSVYLYVAAAILFTLLIGSIVLTGYLSYSHGYIPTIDEQYHLLEVLYDPPWTRIGPYIVGMITAYILIRLDNKLQMRKRTVFACWCLGSSFNILVLFGLWERNISIMTTAFYVGLSRTVWALGLSWLLIACCTNHGGIVHRILSFKGWVPLSRLTFCAYLLNPLLMNSVNLHGESSTHVDALPNAASFMGNFVITYFAAYVFTLMAETPYVLLMRQLEGSRTAKL